MEDDAIVGKYMELNNAHYRGERYMGMMYAAYVQETGLAPNLVALVRTQTPAGEVIYFLADKRDLGIEVDGEMEEETLDA